MRKRIVILALLSAFLQGCTGHSNNSAGVDAPADRLQGGVKMSAEYSAFAKEADSILNHLDSQIVAFNKRANEPSRRRHFPRSRRDAIQAEYRLENLRKKLDERTCNYNAAIETLDRIEKGNPYFMKDYRTGLADMEGLVNGLWKDTLK